MLGHEDFRFIGSSRTDSGVNCRQAYVQLFLNEKMDLESLLPILNINLSGEIVLNSVLEVPREWNLIQSVSKKTYRYFFAEEHGFPPFASAFVSQVHKFSPLESMQEKANLFLGKHDFRDFCKITPNKSDFFREVKEAKVYQSKDFTGDFFPKEVFCFEVTGTGFLYKQVRKMVSAIWHLTSDEIQRRLAHPGKSKEQVPTAPAQGLILWETFLDHSTFS